MTDKIVQDYLRALLLLLEHDRVEDVKECLKMSIVEDKPLYKYMVEYVSNKVLHTEFFDTEAKALKYTEELYNECLLSSSVKRVKYIPSNRSQSK
jgi:hypothetical protein